MLGQSVVYDEIPWFWSDQYDATLQYAGFHTTWEDLVVRGQPESGSFLACYLNDGTCSASRWCTTRSRGSGRTNTTQPCSTPVSTRRGKTWSYVGSRNPAVSWPAISMTEHARPVGGVRRDPVVLVGPIRRNPAVRRFPHDVGRPGRTWAAGIRQFPGLLSQ